jgi:hypothetical protein
VKAVMRTFIFISFIFCAFNSKSQSVFIYAAEKIKTAEVPVARTEFDIIINDTLKVKRTSASDGGLGRIALEKGKYTLRIINPEFSDGFEKEVIVNEYKTTEVSVFVTRLTKEQLEEKSKKK